ncbi:MAG: hypothetical protein H5T59_15100, partial [Anaerolineae bacterium]|nr:hypothetical protein [Anaerolineae bacterium]
LYYALDGGEWAVWAIPAGEGGRWTWTWSRVGSPVWLDAGSHTLAFRGREHDTRLDRLEVTTDVAYQPSTIEPCGQPPWTPTPTQTATPTPTPTLTPTPAIQWFVEAEEGGLVWPMQAHWDEEASACLYVGSDTRDAGAVSFGFDITEADFYFVHARAMGLGWDQNSFWVSVDDGPEHIWEIEPGEGGTWTWVWDAVTSLALNPGPHVLTLRAREAGARVDRLEFASRADLPRSILPCGATGTPSPTPTATSPAPSTPTATATPTRTATPSPTVPAGWMRRAYLPLVPVEQGGGVR